MVFIATEKSLVRNFPINTVLRSVEPSSNFKVNKLCKPGRQNGWFSPRFLRVPTPRTDTLGSIVDARYSIPMIPYGFPSVSNVSWSTPGDSLGSRRRPREEAAARCSR